MWVPTTQREAAADGAPSRWANQWLVPSMLG